MGKIITKNGDIYGGWKVIEANVINPDTNEKTYIGRAVFSKCICTQCNKTIQYIKNNRLIHLTGICKSCTTFNRNIQNREVQVGKKYGMLTVIDNGEYRIMSDGKKRHYSLCQCDCGSNPILVMDNKLQTLNTTSCGCLSSRGEQEIKTILNANNILYNYDMAFPELVQETGRKLRFDFIIYKSDGTLSHFVEFDGNQHKTGMWGGSWSNIEDFDTIHERDEIKNNFCKQHNYILIRIPYQKLGKITLQDIMGDE